MLDIQSLTDEIQHLSESVAWWNKWLIVGMAATAIAASGLVIAQIMVNRESKRLAETQDKLIKLKDAKLAEELADKGLLIANANERAAKAEERAAEANEKGFKANERAEKLERDNIESQRQLEEERRERLSLEHSLAPRHIPGSSLSIGKLKPFAGTQVTIWYLEDTEVRRAAESVESIVKAAGWTVLASEARPELDNREFDGVIVWVPLTYERQSPSDSEHAGQLLAAVRALTGVLQEHDWTAEMRSTTPKHVPHNTIRITIGLKPNPHLSLKERMKLLKRLPPHPPESKP